VERFVVFDLDPPVVRALGRFRVDPDRVIAGIQERRDETAQ
jgi:hypothetical protein